MALHIQYRSKRFSALAPRLKGWFNARLLVLNPLSRRKHYGTRASASSTTQVVRHEKVMVEVVIAFPKVRGPARSPFIGRSIA